MTKPFQIHDKYFLEAKRLGYRARSAFKLIELQEKYKLIHPKMRVLDVGAAPWSFLQVIGKIVWQEWLVVGIDLKKMDPNFGFWNVHLLQESIFEFEKIKIFLQSIGANNKETNQIYKEKLKELWTLPSADSLENSQNEIIPDKLKFDLITSDIAPATSGITGIDQYRSIELNLAILDVAKIFLKKDADLVLKVFVGEDIQDLIGPIKKEFKKLSRMKPKACRDRSFEEYFICQGKL